MSLFSYLVMFQNRSELANQLSEKDLRGILGILKSTPGLLEAKLYTPVDAHDYHSDDSPCLQLALQLYFGDLTSLESVIGKDGHLQALAVPGAWPSLADTYVTHQVMVTRPFPVIDSAMKVPAGGLPCSYLVHYPGRALDFNAWLNYYLSHHPQVMKLYPGIREIEIFTRVDWCDAMPWERVNYMQRNKLVFDSPEALTEALFSSVRDKMRADYRNFPEFEGGSIHYSMSTMTVSGTLGN